MPRRPRTAPVADPEPEPAAPILRNDPIPDAALGLEPEDWTRRLDHIYEGVAADVKVLMERFERFRTGWPLKASPVPGGQPEGLEKWNDDIAGRVADLRKDFQDALKKADNFHDLEKAPVLRAARAIDGFHNKFAEKIALTDGKRKLLTGVAHPLNLLSERLNIYLQYQERARREVAEEAAAEARHIADEAIQRASRTMSAVALDHAADASARSAEASALANAPPAELSRVRGEGGATASLRRRFAFVPERSNLMELVKAVAAGNAPVEYLAFNEGRIGYAVRSEQVREIPGCAIEEVRNA